MSWATLSLSLSKVAALILHIFLLSIRRQVMVQVMASSVTLRLFLLSLTIATRRRFAQNEY